MVDLQHCHSYTGTATHMQHVGSKCKNKQIPPETAEDGLCTYSSRLRRPAMAERPRSSVSAAITCRRGNHQSCVLPATLQPSAVRTLMSTPRGYHCKFYSNSNDNRPRNEEMTKATTRTTCTSRGQRHSWAVVSCAQKRLWSGWPAPVMTSADR